MYFGGLILIYYGKIKRIIAVNEGSKGNENEKYGPGIQVKNVEFDGFTA